MRGRSLARAAGFLALLGALACSVLVENSELDEGCGAGTKLCGEGNCVDNDDPAHGCKPNSCSPCRELENAFPDCANGECVLGACLFGFACDDCSANILTDVDNCGTCGRACDPGQTCRLGDCIAH